VLAVRRAAATPERLVKKQPGDPTRKRVHKKHALELLRSPGRGGIEFRTQPKAGIRLNAELPRNFRLLQALGLYVVDAASRSAR